MTEVKKSHEGVLPACKNCRNYYIDTRGERDKAECLIPGIDPVHGIGRIRKKCLKDGAYKPQVTHRVIGYNFFLEERDQLNVIDQRNG